MGQAMKRAAVAATAAMLCLAVQAQPVYKWVDAQGKTHYGSQPPPTQQLEPLKLQNTQAPGGGAAGTPGKVEYNPDGTKKLPKDVEELVEGMTKGLGTVDGKQVPMNCAASVSNIHGQADAMLEVGQKNVRDGYLARSSFEKTAGQIRQARGSYSLSDCQRATGNKKSFYQCMSGSSNHVLGCSKQFKH